jgi:RecA/RadA recombinase
MVAKTSKKKKVEPIEVVKDKGTTYLSTGILALDVSLGGGFRESSFHGLFSVKSGGKSTTCINAMKSAIEKYPDKKVLYILTEAGGVTEDRLLSMGVDIDKVDLISEMQIEVIEGFLVKASSPYKLANNLYSLIIIDSINNTTNQYDLDAQGVGYSRSAQFIGKLLKTISTAMVLRKLNPDQPPLTTLITMQASANMEASSYEKYLPKGGEALKHCLDTVVRFSSREADFGADVDGTVRMNASTEYKLKFIKKHPVVAKIAGDRKPWFIVNASYYKHRGIFTDSCSYLVSNVTTNLLNTVPEEVSLRIGKEYMPITLYELANKASIGFKEGHGSIPIIDVKTTSKENLIKTLAFGVEVGTGVVVDYDKLIKYIIAKMRFEMSLQSKGLELLPDDNYLCGRFFDREEFLAIAEELREKEMPVLEMSLADYANEILGLTN